MPSWRLRVSPYTRNEKRVSPAVCDSAGSGVAAGGSDLAISACAKSDAPPMTRVRDRSFATRVRMWFSCRLLLDNEFSDVGQIIGAVDITVAVGGNAFRETGAAAVRIR